MKRTLIQIILTILWTNVSAQTVSNIRAEQRGQDIVILYSLETNSLCEVSLLLSLDNGKSWSLPLQDVSGDAGRNITSGEKQIVWDALNERSQLVGDAVKFKVICCETKIARKRNGKDNWFRISFITLVYFAYYQLWRLVKP